MINDIDEMDDRLKDPILMKIDTFIRQIIYEIEQTDHADQYSICLFASKKNSDDEEDCDVYTAFQGTLNLILNSIYSEISHQLQGGDNSLMQGFIAMIDALTDIVDGSFDEDEIDGFSTKIH